MKQRFPLLFPIFLAFCLPQGSEAARKYRYTLNPHRAEEILAGISLNGPTPTEKWVAILGGKKNESYTVQSGDNLWGIAHRVTGNPRLWPKLWQTNAGITNPHELSVGQVLSFYRESAESRGFEIPLIRLIPNRPGAVTDLDSDSVINITTKNQFRSSFMVIDEQEFLGEITAASGHGEWVAELEFVYLKLNTEEAPVTGTKYSVVRVDRDIVDKTTSERTALGTLVRLVGEIEVLSNGDGLGRAQVNRHNEVIRRGDKLISLREPLKSHPIVHPPEELTPRIVMGEIEGAEFFTQGQVVLLNRGENAGVKEGQLFRAVIEKDHLTGEKSGLMRDQKGEVQVMSVGPLSSVGLILRCRHPLTVGDELLAAQLFPENPPQPKRELTEIELN
jgi:hypothetical protein